MIDRQALAKLREAAAATHRYERLRVMAPAIEPTWWMINEAINACIATGLYGEALDWPARRNRAGLDGVRPSELESAVLVAINLAEAHYNLGDWEAAWACMVGLDDRARGAPITRAGLLLQRAWILAHRSDGEEALRRISAARIGELPANFRTEHHFTRAMALLALSRHDEARLAIAQGRAIAVRPSSHRNAHFLAGRVDAAAERWGEAERHLRAGAEHRYRFQGGDGLLLWGDVLARLGRSEEARRAWRRAIAQDPQSESAAIAEGRLGGDRGASSRSDPALAT